MAKSKSRPRRYRPSSLTHSGFRRLPRPRVEIDRGLAWYAIWSAARAEQRIAKRLGDAGLAAYVPLETVERVRRNRVIQDARPAVSRYLFVGLDGARPDFEAVHGAIDDFGGLVSLGRLLATGDGPIRVPAGALQRLADGLSLFDQPKRRFCPGGRVRAREGVWAGFLGEVERADDVRVRALMDLFGRKTPIEFGADQLEAA